MASDSLRLVFAGTPGFAEGHLRALLDSPHEIVAVYTQPDRPAGRGKKLTPSPVKLAALEAGLPVLQPVSLKSEEAAVELAALNCDVMVVVAYGLILPRAILDCPRLGCLNVHASLLPRWRGAAPIQRAIEAGDSETGICIMKMDTGLDTGPVLARAFVPIGEHSNAASLHDELLNRGPGLLLEVLGNLDGYLDNAEPQDDNGVSYAHKIEKAEAELDWSLDANTLHRKVRAFNPFPVAWSRLGDQRLKIWEASPCPGDGPPGEILSADPTGISVTCGRGALCIQRLQLPGGQVLDAEQILNARRKWFTPGTVLGVQA